MNARVPLPAADSAWLQMERPENLMTITGVLTFAERLPFDALQRVVRERFLRHERFRMRVGGTGRALRRAWFERCDVDLDHHLRRIELPGGTDTAALQRHVSRVMGTPLDRDRPLWRWEFIERFGSGSALVGRIHHCIGDGMSLLGVMLDMTDEDMDEGGSDVRRRASGTARWLSALRAAPTLAQLLVQPEDPPTPFRGGLSRAKHATWSVRRPLDEIRELAAGLGGTINDVLLAAVTGGLHRYLAARVPLDESAVIRAAVPVDLRASPTSGPLTNRFGLVFLPLPVGRTDPRRRFHTLRASMERIKATPEAPLVFAALRAIGVAGPSLRRRVVEYLGRRTSAVVTNVPGPRRALHLAGVRIDDFMFWVPQSGDVGLGVSILSYAGGVRVGLAADAGRVPDLDALLADVDAALDELRALAASAAPETAA